MTKPMKSQLDDSDMQGAPQAMLRAAQRARDVARQTNTPLVFMRDGVLVHEYVTDPVASADEQRIKPPVKSAV